MNALSENQKVFAQKQADAKKEYHQAYREALTDQVLGAIKWDEQFGDGELNNAQFIKLFAAMMNALDQYPELRKPVQQYIAEIPNFPAPTPATEAKAKPVQKREKQKVAEVAPECQAPQQNEDDTSTGIQVVDQLLSETGMELSETEQSVLTKLQQANLA